MVAVAKPQAPIRVTFDAYTLAKRIYSLGAFERSIPITKDMTGGKLSELKREGVVDRTGYIPGPYGTLGTVRLLVPIERLESKSTRSSRVENSRSRYVESVSGIIESSNSLGLSIAALEEYVRSYRSEESQILDARKAEVQGRISDLQRLLKSASPTEFRTLMFQANAALHELDDIEHAVAREILVTINPGSGSPLFPVWKAMRGIT